MHEITVIKKNTAGVETWRYNGRNLKSCDGGILLDAFFDREDIHFHGILLGKGDRFVEAYFSQRWFNIFEMRDREDDRIKGYYCNVTCPAVFSDRQIEYTDLALDLLFYPDGRSLLLDEDEFAELNISDQQREKALQAVADLQELFSTHTSQPLEKIFPWLCAQNGQDLQGACS